MLRALREPDLDALVAHLERHAAESGRGGAPIFSPHDPQRRPDGELLRARRRVGWIRSPSEPSWQRTWGWLDGDAVVAHVELHGGKLASELHRATLGLGVEAAHRRRGIGRALVRAAVDWARSQASLAWIDLGVFGENRAAQALYRELGFREVGRVPDRFRVAGESIEDRQMVLSVAELLPESPGSG
jgi:ribosomal protein S18 acetylase RimI-like enzyme